MPSKLMKSVAYYIHLPEQVAEWLMEIIEYELCSIDHITYSENDKLSITLHSENIHLDIEQTISNTLIQNGISETSFRIERKEIERQNWNKEWESQFDPIHLTPELTIRAPFHPKSTTPNELIIMPKMSFGTGHHGTTKLIVQELLQMNLDQAQMLDMGCGTGILGIAALKFGAKQVEFHDIDDWCVDNTLENLTLNNCSSDCYHVGLQTVEELIEAKASFDHILANINYNVLKVHLPSYAKLLATKADAAILLSGFYEAEAKLLIHQLDTLGFNAQHTCLSVPNEVDRWCMIKATRK